MGQGMMVYGEAMADHIRRLLSRRKNITEKKMFGGIGFLLNGNLLLGYRKERLLVRLGLEEGEAALMEDHVTEFISNGRSLKGWVLVATESIKDDDQLRSWIQRALKFVSKLPKK